MSELLPAHPASFKIRIQLSGNEFNISVEANHPISLIVFAMNPLQHLQKYSLTWVLILAVLIMKGCSDINVNGPGENPEVPTLMETISSDNSLTIMVELLEGSSLKTVLESNGSNTIFVPTDAAFQKLPAGYLESLDIDQKRSLLEYHAYQGSYRITNEMKREAIVTMQGDPLFMETGQSFGHLINNRSRFVQTNTEASNGTLHIIDEVLIPDQMGTLFDNIHKRYEYKNFTTRLEAAGLTEFLKAPGNKTLLTTSDVAIDWYGSGEGLHFEDAEWKEIMEYHVLSMDFTTTGPGTKTALPTLHQDSVYLVVDQPGEFLINGGGGRPVQQVFATNGKIVLPSGIMLPDKFLGVLTIMDKRFSFKMFRAATVVAGMTGRMYNGENNASEKFTVFVPGDNAAGINSLPEDKNELTELMKYHVLLDHFDADELQHNQKYTTWQGKELTITKNGSQILVNGVAAVKQPQMTGDNGVVYVIDRVLTVPDN